MTAPPFASTARKSRGHAVGGVARALLLDGGRLVAPPLGGLATLLRLAAQLRLEFALLLVEPSHDVVEKLARVGEIERRGIAKPLQTLLDRVAPVDKVGHRRIGAQRRSVPLGKNLELLLVLLPPRFARLGLAARAFLHPDDVKQIVDEWTQELRHDFTHPTVDDGSVGGGCRRRARVLDRGARRILERRPVRGRARRGVLRVGRSCRGRSRRRGRVIVGVFRFNRRGERVVRACARLTRHREGL